MLRVLTVRFVGAVAFGNENAVGECGQSGVSATRVKHSVCREKKSGAHAVHAAHKRGAAQRNVVGEIGSPALTKANASPEQPDHQTKANVWSSKLSVITNVSG